jgi:hypothetical protein
MEQFSSRGSGISRTHPHHLTASRTSLWDLRWWGVVNPWTLDEIWLMRLKEEGAIHLIQMQFNEWIIEIDLERTKQYYSNHKIEEDCSCLYCDNYRANCEMLSPPLKEFFYQLGIDPRKEGEFMDLNTGDDKLRSIQGMYHIVGRVLSGPDDLDSKWNEIDLIKIDTYKFGFNRQIYCLPEDFPTPTVQLDFTAVIPWVLEIKPE